MWAGVSTWYLMVYMSSTTTLLGDSEGGKGTVGCFSEYHARSGELNGIICEGRCDLMQCDAKRDFLAKLAHPCRRRDTLAPIRLAAEHLFLLSPSTFLHNYLYLYYYLLPGTTCTCPSRHPTTISMRLRDLYKVETLDTRFAGSGQALPTAQASKWASR